MNISYDYYRIFYCVAKYGNLSQAAKVLMNNQPNLTRTIKNLESALGCPLFSRTNRGMKLTPEGKKLYAHVRIAFEHLEAGEAEIAESRNLETGAVSVAASEVALRCLLLPVLKRYRARYPGIRVRISNNSTPQAVAALKDGAADIAVVTTPTVESATLTERSIRPIHEKAVCTKAFPDLIGRPVTLAELAEHPLISLGPETKSYEFHTRFFADHGLPFHPDIEAATADQVPPMVEASLGVGFVPEEFLPSMRDVFAIDLVDTIPSRSICVVKRKDQPLSVAAHELERLIIAEGAAETAQQTKKIFQPS